MSTSSCFRLVGWGVAGALLTGCTLIFGIEEGQLGASGGSGGDGGSSTSTGANNAGGNSNGGNATGAGGQGGGVGGQGGSGPMCTALDPFDIVTSADVSGATLNDERIITATRPSDNRVHVAIQVGNNQMAARTVRLNAVVEQSPLVVFPTANDSVNRRIAGAYANTNEFRVWGQQNNVAGEFVFAADSDIGDPNVTFVAYPAPTGANQCGQLRSLSVYVDDGGVARFAASCFTSSAPQQAIMYGGRTNGVVEWLLGPVALDAGGEIPADMNVRAYAHLGSEHVIIADADDFGVSSPKLRHGGDQTALTAVTDINGPPNQALVFVAGPSTGPAKLFIAALHADPDSIFSGTPMGGYATGNLDLSQLGGFADDPLATLGHEFAYDVAEEVAVPFSVNQNGPTFVGGAVSNFDISKPSRVRLYMWDADGAPLVVGFPVFETATQGQLLTATTAPAGFGSLLSAWTEQTNGVYSLRGARVQCVGN